VTGLSRWAYVGLCKLQRFEYVTKAIPSETGHGCGACLVGGRNRKDSLVLAVPCFFANVMVAEPRMGAAMFLGLRVL
jgi:hypothetical protein